MTQTWAGSLFNFQLGQLPAYTDLTNAFNAYRIKKVRMHFIPVLTGIDGEAGTTVRQVPRLYTAIDRSSNPQYNSETAIQQYDSLRVIDRPLEPFSVVINNPAVWEGVASAISVAYSEPKSNQWISCDTTNIPHYGAVIGGIVAAGTAGLSYNIVATYTVEFKDPR